MSPDTDDLPSVDTEQCDFGQCKEPWAWACPEEKNGPRQLRLCEEHATAFLMERAS